MKLTIVPIDGTVCEDDLCYMGLTWEGSPANVHALQWLDVAGSIEFVDGTQPNEEITVLPDWANNAMASWQIAYDNSHKPAPDPLPPTLEQNQITARNLLYQTDWTTISDVSNPATSNPYLSNANEFLIYRNQVRQYAVYPVAGDIVWPIVPQAIWVKV